MKTAPRGMRVHIGLFGRRNAGKSSLLNALTRQEVSIVSETAGTTTDPVEKPMELLPIGPVQFIDTAGIDDAGALGAQRVGKSRQVIERCDSAVIVIGDGAWTPFEQGLVEEFRQRSVPVIVCFNKRDVVEPEARQLQCLADDGLLVVQTTAVAGTGLLALREALIACCPDELINPPSIVGDLVAPGSPVLLVVPIDLEAPKGRLILPQVQTIRDLLDSDAWAVVVKERELRDCLDRFTVPPALVVCDSQVFLKVAGDTPPEIPMTSFSILFARFKGDLPSLAAGATAIDRLRPGDKVLMAESCSHHPIGDDIGRVKIPRWLTQYVGGQLDIQHVQGHDFPADLARYRLCIHCGSCTHNRRSLLNRIARCQAAGVPITNYGMAIAWSLGIYERALAPFPAALEAVRAAMRPASSS